MATELESVSGRRVRAIEVFAHALRFFREHVLKVKYKTRSSFSLFPLQDMKLSHPTRHKQSPTIIIHLHFLCKKVCMAQKVALVNTVFIFISAILLLLSGPYK